MQEPLGPGDRFLKVDEDPKWLSSVKRGEIVVLRDVSQRPIKVPSGLIHDWYGAAFIGQTNLNQVLSVVRDYDRYQEFYSPNVVDSKTLSTGELEDRFSMVLVNKSLLLETAFASDYKCRYVRVSDRRWYSITESTRIQEIENRGTPKQNMLPEGEGKGLLWRLFSITRFEERDGGVYVELEAIGLSRDIPVPVRWMIEPIVRRVSRSSLVISLQQTEGAVRAGVTRAGCDGPGTACTAATGFAPADRDPRTSSIGAVRSILPTPRR